MTLDGPFNLRKDEHEKGTTFKLNQAIIRINISKGEKYD